VSALDSRLVRAPARHVRTFSERREVVCGGGGGERGGERETRLGNFRD